MFCPHIHRMEDSGEEPVWERSGTDAGRGESVAGGLAGQGSGFCACSCLAEHRFCFFGRVSLWTPSSLSCFIPFLPPRSQMSVTSKTLNLKEYYLFLDILRAYLVWKIGKFLGSALASSRWFNKEILHKYVKMLSGIRG